VLKICFRFGVRFLIRFKSSKLKGYRVTELQDYRLKGYRITELQDYRVTGLPD
jgi:hypothetical protein